MKRPGARFATQVAVTVALLGALTLLAAYVVPKAGTALPTSEPSTASSQAPVALPPGAEAIPGAPGVKPSQPGTFPGSQQPTTDTGASASLANWAQTMGTKTGIPARAVQAYGYAEVRVSAQLPGCHLSWTTLAGIGVVESNHGRALTPAGKTQTPIIGPPLDGTAGNKAIPDTDKGALDGDTKWDRAVGPMQFIPTTWNTWKQDADGDGQADPQDLDDVALAAGLYLCAGGRDLATGRGWYDAVLSYNHLDAYVVKVYGYADDYGRKSAA
ncbi:murein transglycosylase [Actinorhabdospora filicis]|uniref:Murein transglycosylase n=1 Tax=Actinorhabdospora filicis TaxID=1785913 RepID=A0A9W6SJI1_9ACTN|nr:murein transglycosylase [Actinorhabdospora filicis]